MFVVKYHRDSTIDIFSTQLELLADRAEGLVLWDDRLALRDLLYGTVREHEVVEYAFIERRGRPYVHSFEKGVPKALLSLPYKSHDTPVIRELENKQGQRFFDMTVPVGDENAVLHLGLSSTAITQQSLPQVLSVIVLGASAIVVGIIMAVVITRLITREVNQAASALRAHVVELVQAEADRKRAEEALQKSKGFLQTVIDAIPEAMIVISRNYRIALANQAIREKHGGRDLVADGLTCHHVSHHSDTPCSGQDDPCPLRQVVATKAPVLVTHTHYDIHGNESIVEVAAAPILDEAGEVIQIIEAYRDITDRKRAEQELARYQDHLEELVGQRTRELKESQEKMLQTERLASLGSFAAGIAHEINNPLASILITAQHALKLENDRDIVNESLGEIVDDTERCARIVKNVLQFAKQEASEKHSVNLNDIVQRAASLTQKYAQRRSIHLEIELSNDIPSVTADPMGLEQVFVNVINNALEASSKGQRIMVYTKQVVGKVRVCVEDSGRGMTEEERQHAFDPYFTTRTKDGGTGLGLSMVHGIVTEHNGTIDINTESGKGTTITIEFPIMTASTNGDVT